jgi:hypothetical protein
MCGRRAADLAHRHLAEGAHQAVLPFGCQRLPDRTGQPIAHRVIQASAPRHTALEYRVSAARRFVSNYQRRLLWDIEEVFRALKSDGMRLEETQVHAAVRLFRLAVVGLAAACRTIQLVDARDGSPRPATDVIDPTLLPAAEAIGPTLEGKTERQKNHHPQHSLAWLSWIIARLGGWNCYYKPPGPKTMRAGWARFATMAAGFTIAELLKA